MDTLLSGAVPIMTDPEQVKILPDFVPWQDISYMVPVDRASTFTARVRALVNSTQEYEEKVANISKYADVFNHKKPRQVDLYLHKFAQLLDLY